MSRTPAPVAPPAPLRRCAADPRRALRWAGAHARATWRLRAMQREVRRVHALLARLHAQPDFDCTPARDRRLRAILRYAARHCLYYREQFARCSVDPTDLAAFERLPLLDKATIRARRTDLLSDEADEMDKYIWNTGGSTGEPLEFPVSSLAGRINWLHQEFRYRELCGYGAGDRIAAFTGATVPEEARRRNVFWIEKEQGDMPNGRLFYSSLYLDERTMPFYIAHLLEFRPTFLRGYPSFLNDIAVRLLAEGRARPFPVKAVELTAENAFDWQVENIRKAFGAKVLFQYGHSEVCVYGYTMEDGGPYLCSPFYGLTEVLGPDGRRVAPGGSGEVVVTGFYNRALPMLRYRTGDVAVLDSERNGVVRLRSITGRTQDYVYGRDGTRVALTALVHGQHYRAFARIRTWQIEQDTPGEVAIAIVRGEGFGPADEAEVRGKFHDICGVEARLRYVDDIPRTQRGKVRFVVQHLPGPAPRGPA